MGFLTSKSSSNLGFWFLAKSGLSRLSVVTVVIAHCLIAVILRSVEFGV